MIKRPCSVRGCQVKLAPDNTSGICPQCMAIGKTEARHPDRISVIVRSSGYTSGDVKTARVTLLRAPWELTT